MKYPTLEQRHQVEYSPAMETRGKKHVPAWIVGVIGLAMLILGYGGIISVGGFMLIVIAILQKIKEKKDLKNRE